MHLLEEGLGHHTVDAPSLERPHQIAGRASDVEHGSGHRPGEAFELLDRVVGEIGVERQRILGLAPMQPQQLEASGDAVTVWFGWLAVDSHHGGTLCEQGPVGDHRPQRRPVLDRFVDEVYAVAMLRTVTRLVGVLLLAIAVALVFLPVVADFNGTAGQDGGGGGAVPTFRCGWGLLTEADHGDSFVADSICDAAEGIRITRIGLLTVAGLVLVFAPSVLGDRLRLDPDEPSSDPTAESS